MTINKIAAHVIARCNQVSRMYADDSPAFVERYEHLDELYETFFMRVDRFRKQQRGRWTGTEKDRMKLLDEVISAMQICKGLYQAHQKANRPLDPEIARVKIWLGQASKVAV